MGKQQYILKLRTLMVGFLVMYASKGVAQDREESDSTNYPKLLHKAYKERTLVIQDDTVAYRHRWFLPGQYKLQYAGSIGFMSVGFGYAIGEIYQPALFFGYLGEHFGGSKNSVFSVSLKNSFNFTRKALFEYFRPYGGLSITWGNTHNTFRKLPDYYPQKYYFQNKVHFSPFVGGELRFDIKGAYFEGFGVYAEVSSLDAYLLEAIRTKYVKPYMTLSLAVGATLYLR